MAYIWDLIYLIFDTNIWLYLANGLDTASNSYHENRHFELLNSLKDHVQRGHIRIIKNYIVVEEWNRNKAHAFNQVNKLKERAKQAAHMLKKNAKAGDMDGAKECGKSLRELEERIRQNERHIEAVEDFLLNYCEEVAVTDKIKLWVFDFSMTKRAPFHNKKNNNADAAILLSAAEYLKEELRYDDEFGSAFFISNNVVDFSSSADTTKFHPDILGILPTGGISFQTYLPEALKISEEILEDMREFHRRQSLSFACESIVCSGQDDFVRFGYQDRMAKWKYESDDQHTTQLDLFTGAVKSPKDRGHVKCGNCVFCGTLHVDCPHCGELVCAEQEARFKCEECETVMAIVSDPETDEDILVVLDMGYVIDEDES